MRTRLLPALSALAALAALALASPAAAAPPAPFGHPCAPSDGALLCPTSSDAARVPSFDGVPRDVDVYLPPTGDGPFPTIAMLHGSGGSYRPSTGALLGDGVGPARLAADARARAALTRQGVRAAARGRQNRP